MEIRLFSDGGARGNPGPAAIAALGFSKDGKQIFQVAKKIGETTNNQAEYLALIEGIEEVKRRFNPERSRGVKIKIVSLNCFLDSELVVNQLNGSYKVKDSKLKPLFAQVRSLVMELGGRVSFSYIPRSQNRLADKLVNQMLG